MDDKSILDLELSLSNLVLRGLMCELKFGLGEIESSNAKKNCRLVDSGEDCDSSFREPSDDIMCSSSLPKLARTNYTGLIAMTYIYDF